MARRVSSRGRPLVQRATDPPTTPTSSSSTKTAQHGTSTTHLQLEHLCEEGSMQPGAAQVFIGELSSCVSGVCQGRRRRQAGKVCEGVCPNEREEEPFRRHSLFFFLMDLSWRYLLLTCCCVFTLVVCSTFYSPRIARPHPTDDDETKGPRRRRRSGGGRQKGRS